MTVQTSIKSFFSPVKWRENARLDSPSAGAAETTPTTTCTSSVSSCTKRPWLPAAPNRNERNPAFEPVRSERYLDLGDGSHILYYPKFLDLEEADGWLKALDRDLPWSRATFHIYGQDRLQPRKSVYVAERNLPTLRYSGEEPEVHFWEEFPVLGQILEAVRKVLPGIKFNSVLVNRYADGQDHVGWHSDDTKVFGPTPTIASVTLGAEREFLVRMKKHYKQRMLSSLAPSGVRPRSVACGAQHMSGLERESAQDGRQPGDDGDGAAAYPGHDDSERVKSRVLNSGERAFTSSSAESTQPLKEKYSFLLKHGSLLVMKGNMQRDWQHTVPKRSKVTGVRINLTFRIVVSEEQGRYLGQYRR